MSTDLRRSVGIAGLVAAIAGAACDGAFRSGGAGETGGTTFELELAFDDGSDEATVIEGEAALLRVQLPRSGYDRVVVQSQASVDVSRVAIFVDVDLGDPMQGGFAAGENLVEWLDAAGRIAVELPADAPPRLLVTLDTVDPIPFPVGRMLWSVLLLDDIDRASQPLRVGLTVRALDRPTAVAQFEIPPADRTPTGVSLPLDADGVPFVGERLPFALTVRAIPNPESGAGFTRLFQDGAVDPERLIVTADRDLGDPGNGGFFPGENLAPIFGTDLDVFTDPDTGELLIGALFPIDAPFSPSLGDTVFTAVVVDDADSPSDPSSGALRAEAPVTLSGSVQPIFTPKCATGACHDATGPAASLDLSDGHTWGECVNVRAGQTPSDSCATLLVEPYFPGGSYLHHKVKGTHRGGCVKGSGTRMPRSGAPLSDAQIALIARWVLQGAHDN